MLIAASWADLSKVRKAPASLNPGLLPLLGLEERRGVPGRLILGKDHPLPPPPSQEEAMQMETEISLPALCPADVFSKCLAWTMKSSPAGKGAQREKGGKRVAYLSVLSAFIGGEHTAQTWQPPEAGTR